MGLEFWKMQGCGNDFIVIDSIENPGVRVTKKEIVGLCDRYFGVGADGLVILERAEKADARWNFFNCDGSAAEMCGNAARCSIRFLAETHFKSHEIIALETRAGVIRGKKLIKNLVEVSLFPLGHTDYNYDEKLLHSEEGVLRIFTINTGVPHAVIEVEDIRNYPISRVGKFLVRHPAFGSEGTNVTFFQREFANQILSTTFERGVEKETFACGTGVGAAALVYSQLYIQAFPLQVVVPGGQLEIDLSPYSQVLLLRGNAQYVMKGELHPTFEEVERRTLYEGKQQ